MYISIYKVFFIPFHQEGGSSNYIDGFITIQQHAIYNSIVYKCSEAVH